jgi:hypothetical protein
VLRQLLKDARAPSAGSRDAATDCRAATRALSFWAAVVDVPVEGFQGQLQRAIPG